MIKLRFKTVAHLRMGLPIGAVSPIDFSEFIGATAYVIENKREYKIGDNEFEG